VPKTTLLVLTLLLTVVLLAPGAQAAESGTRVNLPAIGVEYKSGRRTPTPVPTSTKTNPPPTATQTLTPPPASSPTPPPTATRTPTAPPTATFTPQPTATGTPTPSPTTTPTPQPTTTGTPPSQPVRGQPCPQWYHDAITTTGPDGKQYPTWHPAVDPASGCYFGHEHGDDPRTSLANNQMPAFGYVGLLAGDNEPHAGFKVFVQNHGALNSDGRTLAQDARMVFHQGTGGPKRFDTQLHSLEYDFKEVGGSGHELHVKGMADTGGVGSICANPRQGKTVMLLPGNGCSPDSMYEIWAVSLNVGGRAQVNASFGVFDPITIMDPADHTRLLYAKDYPGLPTFFPPFYGCTREAYSGPNYFYNPDGPTTFTTDAFGNPGGPITQYVSRHDDLGVGTHMTTDNTQTQAKLGSDACAPGLTLTN
jgi:hypothetical protein